MCYRRKMESKELNALLKNRWVRGILVAEVVGFVGAIYIYNEMRTNLRYRQAMEQKMPVVVKFFHWVSDGKYIQDEQRKIE